MNTIHGIFACAGNGTRFAESVGKPSPFPKHLQMLGDKTVLHWALEGLINNIGVSSVTFTLNPALQEPYLDYLKHLQGSYPGVEFSFAPVVEIDGARLFTNVKATVNTGVYDLEGQPYKLGNPVVAIALGDSVISKGDSTAIQKDISAYLEDIKEGKSLGIFRNPERGLLYWLNKVSDLGEDPPSIRKTAQDYNLKWWNCNTLAELQIAKRELRLLTDQETTLFKPGRGKER
jgi:hypothetical protein